MPDTLIERHEIPAWVEKRITEIGGLNRFGKPNFRVVWGGNRTHLVGGKFKKPIEVETDSLIIGEPRKRTVVIEVAEVRELLKYHPFRWHLERWRGPEWYGTREDWYRETWDEDAQLHVMGDYPSGGDYEHVFYLAMCSHMRPGDMEWCGYCKLSSGEFIPLEENIHILEQQIRNLLLSDGVSETDERLALYAREDKRREAYRKIVSARVQEAMRPQLAVQPTSWQLGTNSRCSVPEPKILDIRKPLGRSPFRQSNSVLPNRKQEEIDGN